MSKTETQSEALRVAVWLGEDAWFKLSASDAKVASDAAAELRRLDAENKALLDVLEAVEMDVVYVGGGEHVISDATRAKVEAALEPFRATQAAAKNGDAA